MSGFLSLFGVNPAEAASGPVRQLQGIDPMTPGVLQRFQELEQLGGGPPPADAPFDAGSGAIQSVTVTPQGVTGAFPAYSGGGYSYSNLPPASGWFYNSQAGSLQYSNGDGTVSAGPGQAAITPGGSTAQTPGAGPNLGTLLNAPIGAVRALANAPNFIEELAIRAMMVIVGLVFVFGGFYVAGQRSRRGDIVVASPAQTARNAIRTLAA
jgi:hypothetical protein